MSTRHGSATRHWRNQRLTSIALLPLGLWFLFALLRQPSLGHEAVAAWLAMPLQALLAALFGAALLWHSMQGLQVVVEDYVANPLRGLCISILRILHISAGIVLAAALLKLAFSGAA